MSLMDQSSPPRETDTQGHEPGPTASYTDTMPSPKPIYTRGSSYDESLLDEFYGDMMAQTKKAAAASAPALPQKSARRASRLLESFALPTPEPALEQTTPHDVYMSSEEDASSTADDFSDYDFDSESELSAKSPIRSRRSHEDTARLVSVIFSGKPSIIELPPSRRSISPSSVGGRTSSRNGSQNSLPTEISNPRRLSISSVTTCPLPSIGPSAFPHPPRSTSFLPSGKDRPSFLSIDPFARDPPRDLTDSPKTPKTPSAMLKRTLGLVKKRSRPALGSLSNASRDTLASVTTTDIPPEETIGRPSTSSTHSPVTYNDIMKAAKKNAATAGSVPVTPLSPVPQSPLTPTRNRILSFSMGRRRSLKAQ